MLNLQAMPGVYTSDNREKAGVGRLSPGATAARIAQADEQVTLLALTFILATITKTAEGRPQLLSNHRLHDVLDELEDRYPYRSLEVPSVPSFAVTFAARKNC